MNNDRMIIKIEYEYDPKYANGLPTLEEIREILNLGFQGMVFVTKVSLFDLSGQDLGSGLLADTVDALEDEERAEDAAMQESIDSLKKQVLALQEEIRRLKGE